MSDRRQISPFPVPALPQEDTGWRVKLSKWQLALLIGMPIAAAAAIAGLVFLLKRRRRTEPASPPPSLPSQSPTPVTSPAAKKPEAGDSAKASESPLKQARDLKSQGNDFYRQEKFEEAAKCYEEAIRLSVGAGEKDGVVAIYHQNLGAVYDALSRKETDRSMKVSHRRLVVQCCDRAIALNPRYVKALLRRFQMNYCLGNEEDALLDVTRVLLLDESQAPNVGKNVSKLLKNISLRMTAENYPQLGPLAPTKHLLKTYMESFLWQDDLSEERLKALWLSAQPSGPDQSESREQSRDPPAQPAPTQQSQQNGEVEESPQPQEDREQQVKEEEKEKEKEEEKEEKDEGEKEEEKEQEKEEEQAASAEASDSAQAKSKVEERMAGFAEEPFVVAAAQLSRYELGNILELLGEAIEKGNPVFKPHAVLLRGGLHSLWRMEREALKDFQEVINMEGLPKEMYVNALIKKAVIFAGAMEMEKCKACFDKALVIDPNSGDVLVQRARVGLETEDPSNLSTVVQDLEKAVAQAPDFPYALYTLASAYHRMAGAQQSMQMVEAARTKFTDAKKKFPKFADGLILYAMFLQDTSDFQSAESILQEVVQLEPENPLGFFSLGLLQLVLKSDIDQTIVYMQKTLAVDSSCVQAYDTMASIEMQRGNTARGVELYDKAIQFSRNQLEMSQAYVAKKIFTVQEQVCKEYGVPINQVPASAPFPGPGGP